MEELVTVVAIEQGVTWVEADRKSTCGACAARHGCGSAVLTKVLGQRRNRIAVINPVSARVGDSVTIRLDSAALLRGSFAVYMVPLLALFAGALLGKLLIAPILPVMAEGVITLSAVLGLLTGVIWLRHFSRQATSDHRYQPVVTEIVSRVEPRLSPHCHS